MTSSQSVRAEGEVRSDVELGRRLREALEERFGHRAFRPHQEACCLAVARGDDALLVMPTGAGKSLCYQLPGLVRHGATLVVSPLIALIDDQVGKLRGHGLRAAGMHSGQSRDDLYAAARAWREGQLDFLFVAPERLARPGWRELLSRHRPGLVAIDEAHCISHWGHDFRPDYRRLSERLEDLRPAPFLALTATATPRVQDDIVAELGMPSAHRFIHGFRRQNLAIEVLRITPSRRPDAIELLLRDPDHRPALVYCSTRADADQLAEAWRAIGPEDSSAATYHAGLDAEERERVQQAFLGDAIDVVFATVAFGMGVDKPNVRTVVHHGLPGTLEGYYQEIGRAGRDGEDARAVLLYSPIDRRMHEFFFERDYPEPKLLRRWLRAVPAEGIERDTLLEKVPEDDRGEAANCLDKLRVHGALRFDGRRYTPLVETPGDRREAPAWSRSYEDQRRHRAQQIDTMVAFARGSGCRMLEVVRHFGDREDGGEPCGRCDWCTAGGALSEARPLDDEERELAARLVEQIVDRPLALGRAYSEIAEGRIDRDAWRELIEGLARARLVRVRERSFERDGETVRFQRIEASTAGRRAVRADGLGAALESVEVRGSRLPAAPRNGRRRARTRRSSGGGKASVEIELSGEQLEAAKRLRAWRLEESRAREVPAYVVLTNAALDGIASAMPASESELGAVHGVGPKTLEMYGRQILTVVAQA